MRTESNVRPELVERYKTPTRINFGVSEVTRGVSEVTRGVSDEQITMFEYFMVELKSSISYGELVSLLISERYSIDAQIAVLANMDDLEVNEFLEWRRVCKSVARKVLGIKETLDDAKEEKLYDLSIYDKSSAVNLAYVNGMSVWFDAVERIKIKNGIESVMTTGQPTYVVNFNGVTVELECNAALAFFAKLEVYVVQCFNVTESHKYNIKKLESIEEVNSYDFTAGYSEKLNEEIDI